MIDIQVNRDKDRIYPVELADDTCYIPHDALKEKERYISAYMERLQMTTVKPQLNPRT